MPPRKRPAAPSITIPGFIQPARPDLRKTAPSGEQWIHEVKWDGYRIQAHAVAGYVQLFTRNGHNYTERYPAVVGALQALSIAEAIFDGEIIVPNHCGGDFTALHSRQRHSDVRYQIFDLLWLNGRDLRSEPLRARKAALDSVLKTASSPLHFVEWIEGTAGPRVFASASDLGLEGVISKLADAPYRSGDATDWVKTKCVKRAAFVVVGYVPSSHGRGVAALRLAKRDGRKLVYAGKVGTGFSAVRRRGARETRAVDASRGCTREADRQARHRLG